MSPHRPPRSPRQTKPGSLGRCKSPAVQRVARGHRARQEPRLHRHGLLQVRQSAAGHGVRAAQSALSASVRLQVLDVRRPRPVRHRLPIDAPVRSTSQPSPAKARQACSQQPARRRNGTRPFLRSDAAARLLAPNAVIGRVTAPAAIRAGMKPTASPEPSKPVLEPSPLTPQSSVLGFGTKRLAMYPSNGMTRRAQVRGRRGGARVHGRLEQQRDEQGPARHAPVRVLLRRHHVRPKPGSPAERPAIESPPCACGSAGLSISWAAGQARDLGCPVGRPPPDGTLSATDVPRCCPPPDGTLCCLPPGMGARRQRLWAACPAGRYVGSSRSANNYMPGSVLQVVTPGRLRGFQLRLAGPCSLCLVGASTNRR